MHKTLVFVIFPLHSSVFHHRTERFVKFDGVLHHDIKECIHICLSMQIQENMFMSIAAHL